MPAFGRLIQFDDRSRNFPIRAQLTPLQATTPRSYTWRNPIRLDQGSLGSCVGNAWAHELAAKPFPIPGVDERFAVDVYNQAQVIDGFDDTPPEEGTSVLAGAKIISKMGFLLEYRWAFGLDDLILAVGWKGPAVIGVPWYDAMMSTDKRGYVHATGGIVGGHAILCNRVNIRDKFFGLSNSWGSWWGVKDSWGLGGACRISFADVDKLLHEQGEACIPVLRVMK
jgi:hypothetical protein